MRRWIVFSLFALLIVSISFGAEKKPINEMKIGDKAPDFKLPGVDDKTYTLKSFKDSKVLVIIFTCNHCPTAQAYEERMKQLARDYKDKSVAIVAVSPNDPKAVRLDELGYSDLNDSFEEMKIRAKHAKFNFLYLYDGDTQDMSRAYGPTNTPHVFIFDEERALQYKGAIDDSENPKRVKTRYVLEVIDALLAGKDSPYERSPRVRGCSIKWAYKRDSVQQSLDKWAAEEVTLMPIGNEGIKKLIDNESDKLRLINFWHTWCPECIVEFPDLVDTNRMYRHRDFEMITISFDDFDDPEIKKNALKFLKEKQASCTNYIYDGKNEENLLKAVGNSWNEEFPFTLLIKPGGDVIYLSKGIVDPLELRQAIVDVLGRTYQ